MHVTIEETDEGTLICLLLSPNETSSELRSFAASLREPRARRPSASSTRPQTVLRSEEPQKPPSLDVGVVRERTSPAKEDIIAILDQAIRAKKAPLGGAIGALSRGLGNLLFGTGIDPRAGVSLSQQLAEVTDTSIAEVHLAIASPFFAETTSGGALGRAIINDFRVLARAGDVPALQRAFDRLQATEERLKSIQGSQGARIGFGAGGGSPRDAGSGFSSLGRGLVLIRTARALKNVATLKRNAGLMKKLAEKVQGAP